MPRRKRSDGEVVGAAKVRLMNFNNNVHHDDNSMDDGDLDDCGSPLGSGMGSSPQGQPVQRNAANARERARMRVLSKAFCRLKTTLPWVPADTKLSKLDTLRLATSYIAHLRDVLLLPDGEVPSTASSHAHNPSALPNPLNLTWPFAFPQTGAPGVPGMPLSGAEPWISRGTASASSRSAPSRVSGVPGATNPSSGRGPSSASGASSNASSSGADDDMGVHDEEGHDHDGDVNDEQELCRRGRGLSGGCIVELQQHCHGYQPQAEYHPFLQRYVDSNGVGAM